MGGRAWANAATLVKQIASCGVSGPLASVMRASAASTATRGNATTAGKLVGTVQGRWPERPPASFGDTVLLGIGAGEPSSAPLPSTGGSGVAGEEGLPAPDPPIR